MVDQNCPRRIVLDLAKVLAIGTANPGNVMYQADCPEHYFSVTKSDHLVSLKAKLERICENSKIRKRHMYLTDEMIDQNPCMLSFSGPSLNVRQDIVVAEVPKLGEEAAARALKEWGHPTSHITHLIFCTSTGIDMPGADFRLAKVLGLRPDVNRVMLYQQGCFAAGTALRLAKDLAENNRGARVLVVCSEMTSTGFRGLSETDQLNVLIGVALFGDGAAALVVGSDPDMAIERPLFELVWAGQRIIPGSEGVLEGPLRESGLMLRLKKEMPMLIADNMEGLLEEAFGPFGVSDWNSIFWAMHPGGPAILDKVEERLGLDGERLRASRHVLSEYGNMSSPTVLFVLDQIRRQSATEGKLTTGQGMEWGVLFGIGPGITVETVILRSTPLAHHLY